MSRGSAGMFGILSSSRNSAKLLCAAATAGETRSAAPAVIIQRPPASNMQTDRYRQLTAPPEQCDTRDAIIGDFTRTPMPAKAKTRKPSPAAPAGDRPSAPKAIKVGKRLEKVAREIKDADEFVEHVAGLANRYRREYALQ